MSEHDAASNVGRLAGLTEASTPVPPSALIARFCGDAAAAGMTHAHGLRRDDKHNAMKARGFCGFMGGRGDSLVTGFDDGYDFMGFLGDRGWRDLPAKGDWPYVVWMRWPASKDEPDTLIEYCEADLSVWQFDARDAAQAFYKAIKDAP